ncbi:lysyl-tRNA synthetase-like protein [Xylariales sp. PMI_506]|nr:lysyl-tRNA synthetase-like protein [Xylariales sp. PMI_506]
MANRFLLQLASRHAVFSLSASTRIRGWPSAVICIQGALGRSAPSPPARFIASTRPCYAGVKGADNGKESQKETLEESSAVIQRRVHKLKELNAFDWPRIEASQGVPVLSADIFRQMYKDLTPQSTSSEVILRGKISVVRKLSSKLFFLDLTSSFRQVQVMLDFGHINSVSDVPREIFRERVAALLRGDTVSIAGRAVITGKNELTLKAHALPTILSPSLAPIPTSLVNEETIVHKRHLDLFVNHQAADTLRLRSNLVWWVRQFMHDKHFLEVQTPILADSAGGAIARPFVTSATEFPAKELALRIAPELWLKRLVVGGFERIFEIGPVFRNEGIDGTHNPEFTICEFYEAYTDLNSLIQRTTELIRRLAILSTDYVKYEASSLRPVDSAYFDANFEQVEFIPALEKALGSTLPNLEAPDALDHLIQLAQTHLEQEVSEDITLNKLLDSLAGTYIEPKSHTRPLYITHHPACMAPLAKSFTCSRTGQLVSARAELFIKGREIANMYEEENNPFEQRRKFELQVNARNANRPGSEEGQAVVDESYVQALECGLPPTGGWGCGIDRLVMLFSGTTRISDTLTFGTLRNVLAATQASRKS